MIAMSTDAAGFTLSTDHAVKRPGLYGAHAGGTLLASDGSSMLPTAG